MKYGQILTSSAHRTEFLRLKVTNFCLLMSHLKGSEPSWMVEDPVKRACALMIWLHCITDPFSSSLTCSALHRCAYQSACADSKYLCAIWKTHPRAISFSDWKLLSQLNKTINTHTCTRTHPHMQTDTHTVLNEPWLPSISAWFFFSIGLWGNLLLTFSVQNGAHFPSKTTHV